MGPASVRQPVDPAVFAELLQRHRPRLLHVLRRLCGADAEDVLQETLAKVWRLRATFDPAGNGEAWLVRAALRTLSDHRSRRRREPGALDAALEPTAPRAASPIEVREEVAQLLRGLAPLERDLLVGFHAHGLSLRELAARHALPVNTVKSHLHRARARLAAAREADA